jgi:Tfp pilus assembly protein FimT
MSRKRGFTLATLLLIMAVLAVLSAILFPRICADGSGNSSDCVASDVCSNADTGGV